MPAISATATANTNSRFHDTETGPSTSGEDGKRSVDRLGDARTRTAARDSASRSRRRSSPAWWCRCRRRAGGAAARTRWRRRARRRAAMASGRARKKFTPSEHHPHEHHVGAEAVQLAMREVDHPHDAEDQRQPDTQQRIRAAEDEGVETMLEELVHRTWPRAAGQAMRGVRAAEGPPTPDGGDRGRRFSQRSA